MLERFCLILVIIKIEKPVTIHNPPATLFRHVRLAIRPFGFASVVREENDENSHRAKSIYTRTYGVHKSIILAYTLSIQGQVIIRPRVRLEIERENNSTRINYFLTKCPDILVQLEGLEPSPLHHERRSLG
jgi:hypothetical protein